MQLDEYDNVYKVILVGDASVGKTNLIHCYSKGKIAMNTMPTVGVEYTSKIVPLKDNKRAKVQIWDTAGQEQYRSITMGHYKKAVGALVVFDITNCNSFSSLEYWVNIVKERADEAVVIGVIGNKVDLSSKRAISKNDAENLCKKLQVFYHETSIKDFGSIQTGFERLVEDVYEIKKENEYNEQNGGLRVGAGENDGNSGNRCKC